MPPGLAASGWAVAFALLASPAFAACELFPRVNTAEGVAASMQQNGCRAGEVATVVSLPASTAVPLIRRICAFDRQIVVVPREAPRAAGLVDLACIYAPR